MGKKIAKHIVALVIIIFMVIVSVDFIGDLMDTDEKCVSWELYDELDAVFVGSSHIYRGIIPQRIYDDIGLVTGNLAVSNQTIQGSYWMLREYFKRCKSPSVVFVDVTPIYEGPRNAFVVRMLSGINKILGNKELTTTVDGGYTFEEAERFIAFHSKYGSITKEGFDYVNGSGKYAVEHWYTGCWSETEVITQEQVAEIAKSGGVIDDKNLECLNRIIDLIEANGAECVFMIVPYLATNHEYDFLEKAKTLAEERNVEFLDYSLRYNDDIFDLETDFSDVYHLNLSGGIKLTDKVEPILAKYIEKSKCDVSNNINWYGNTRHYQQVYDIRHENDFASKIGEVNELGTDFVTVLYMTKDLYDSLDEDSKRMLVSSGFNCDKLLNDTDNYYIGLKDGEAIREICDSSIAKINENYGGTSICIENSATGIKFSFGTMERSGSKCDGNNMVLFYSKGYSQLVN